jgi:hypothetical protein
MDLESYPYVIWAGRKRRFTTDTFSAHGAASPDFGPIGCVSRGAH